MRIAPAFAALATALPLILTAAAARATPFEDGVLGELNRARANPAAYVRVIEADTRDDPADVEEAIDYLLHQRSLPPLKSDGRIARAAAAHAAVQGPGGGVGHGAPGSLGRRLQSQGVWAGLAAETISYGQQTPRDVVRQLIVDSGVPNRAHRQDLFGANYSAAGVGCGPHARYGAMCVIDFAGAIVQR